MVAYYRHDIAAWMDGTESLSDGEYRVYHVACELIYLQEGPIVANEKGLAGRCNQHILAFRNNLNKLIKKGKLAIIDGKITNRRAATEIERLHKAHPPRTPRQPQANPPATPAEPTPGSPRNSLKLQRVVSKPKNAPVESLSFFSSEDSNLDVVSEERSSGQSRIWDFDQFWMQYPHKVGKGAARKAFDAVMKKTRATFPDVMLGLARYAAKTDDRPWCNPATWLNQERWLDEPAAGGTDGGKGERSLLDAFERISGLVDEAEADAVRDGSVRRLPAGQVR